MCVTCPCVMLSSPSIRTSQCSRTASLGQCCLILHYAGSTDVYTGNTGLYTGSTDLYTGSTGLYTGNTGLYTGSTGL